MKRLITFLITALFLFVSASEVANAANEKLHIESGNLEGGSWGQYNLLMQEPTDGSNVHTYTFTPTSNVDVYFRVKITWEDNSTNAIAPTDSKALNLTENDWTSVGYDGNTSNSFLIKCVAGTTYTIKYDLGTYTGGFNNMKLSYTKSSGSSTELYFRSGLNGSWDANTQQVKPVAGENNKWSIDLDASSYTGDILFRLYDDSEKKFIVPDGGNNVQQELSVGNSTTNTKTVADHTGSTFKIPHATNSYGKYTLTVEFVDSKWKLSLAGEGQMSTAVGEYYLIVPEENIGSTPRAIERSADKQWIPEGHKAFSMIASRERNQTKLNEDLTSVTLKIDGNKGRQLRYKNGKIKFYIYDQTNNEYYRPNQANYEAVKAEGTEYVDGTNVEVRPKYRTSNGRDAIGGNTHGMKNAEDAGDKYYYIAENHSTVTIDGTGYRTMSLTFMFSKFNKAKTFVNDDGTTGNMQNGNSVYYNKKDPGSEGLDREFATGQLLVAFLKTRGVGSKYYEEHITKEDGAAPAGVYLVGKFGNNYLPGKDVGDEEYDRNKYKMLPNYWKDGVIDNTIDPAEADSIVYSCEVKRGTAAWDKFFLSFSTGDVLGKSDTKNDNPHMWNPLLRPRVQNQMDAQALEGGIFYYFTKNTTANANQQQSLNPLLTDDEKLRYASYRVYFNATYSTYRIEFYDKFTIAGPAVNGVENQNVNDHETFGADYRHGMVKETINGKECYRYRGKFMQGSTFAFFVNPETSVANYSEDADFKYVNNNLKEGSDNEYNDMWNTQAPADGKDYPFHNKVRYNKTTGGTDGKSLGTGNNGILWTMPTGVYTLRFYNHKGVDDDNSEAIYTIDKEVVLSNATSEFAATDGASVETHNYGGWRTFSDDCALWLPDDVKAYYVSEINSDKKAVLKEVTGNTIPAHCGVLIYDASLGESSKTISLYPVPTDYTVRLGETNLLKDCYDKTVNIQAKTGDKFNFFLSHRCKNSVGTSIQTPLNFWKAKANAAAKKNYTYLQVDENIHPLSFDADNYKYYESVNNANALNYCFPLSFDGFDDPIITGITSIDSDKNADTSDVWYTIQGVKTNMPNVPGIYIHNGKKVIIK